MKVPLLDLKAQYQAIGQAVDQLKQDYVGERISLFYAI
jgi:hypothetical protein